MGSGQMSTGVWLSHPASLHGNGSIALNYRKILMLKQSRPPWCSNTLFVHVSWTDSPSLILSDSVVTSTVPNTKPWLSYSLTIGTEQSHRLAASLNNNSHQGSPTPYYSYLLMWHPDHCLLFSDTIKVTSQCILTPYIPLSPTASLQL